MWTLLCLWPWWFWVNWRSGSFPSTSSPSFLVLSLELLQSLGYTTVKTLNLLYVHILNYSYDDLWVLSFPNRQWHHSAVTVKIFQLHAGQYAILMGRCYKYLSVPLTDAFMDFTSGILSVTGINATGHIFASYPARHLSVLGGFIDQVSAGHRDPMTSLLLRTTAPIQALNSAKSGKCS